MNSPANRSTVTGHGALGNASSDIIFTDQTTNSTSYTDLATVGPTVTVTTGTEALVVFAGNFIWNGTGFNGYVSVAVSGATTIAASDNWCITLSSEVANGGCHYVQSKKFTGLTPGSNTFTMKYRVNGQTWTFGHRSIWVVVP